MITGKINHDRLIKENLFRLGDIFVTASKSENQPLSIMEAMAFGKPVVASRIGGIPDFVIDGKTGFLADHKNPKDFADKISRILKKKRVQQRF